MKRKLFLACILVICLSILTTGTLAYFTSKQTAHNIITTSGVEIDLRETTIDENGDEVPFEDKEGILPGAEVSKLVRVANTGPAEVWIRVSITKTFDIPGGDPDLLHLNLNLSEEEDGWTQQGDYYYYNKAVAPEEVTAVLFTTVTFDKTMGNEYQNTKAHIIVNAQAVQTANNGSSALEAKGWPKA